MDIRTQELINGKVYINVIEGFWGYVKERLLKFHGVSKDNFIYYLKEHEFRNNFKDNIDDSLCKCLGGINRGITIILILQVDGEKLKLLSLIYMHILLVITFLEKINYGDNFSPKVLFLIHKIWSLGFFSLGMETLISSYNTFHWRRCWSIHFLWNSSC